MNHPFHFLLLLHKLYAKVDAMVNGIIYINTPWSFFPESVKGRDAALQHPVGSWVPSLCSGLPGTPMENVETGLGDKQG